MNVTHNLPGLAAKYGLVAYVKHTPRPVLADQCAHDIASGMLRLLLRVSVVSLLACSDSGATAISCRLEAQISE